MSHCLPILLLGAAATLAAAVPCAAESPSTSASFPFAPVKVAVLDVPRVFRSSRSFQREIERLRAKIDEFKQRQAERQRHYREMADRLDELRPGTPEYEALQAELEAESVRYKTHCYPDEPPPPDVIGREAAVYAAAFERIQAAVADYAGAHGIQLVLRASPGLPEDAAKREAVMHTINRRMVWRDVEDITDAVLDLMEATTRTTAE